MALNKTWAHLYLMASHVSPPLLRGVKVSAFSGRYTLGTSCCEDGAVQGRCRGLQVCEEFPAKFQWVVIFDFEGSFHQSDKNEFVMRPNEQWAAQTIQVLTFEVDEIILAWCDQGLKGLHLSGRKRFRGTLQPGTFSSLGITESVS